MVNLVVPWFFCTSIMTLIIVCLVLLFFVYVYVFTKLSLLPLKKLIVQSII